MGKWENKEGDRDLAANNVAKRFGIPGTSRVPIEHHGLGCADLNLRLMETGR